MRMLISCRCHRNSRDAVVETIAARPADGSLFGSAPNALAFIGTARRSRFQRHQQRRRARGLRSAPAGCPAVSPPAGIRRAWPWTRNANPLVANIKGNGRQNTVAKESARSREESSGDTTPMRPRHRIADSAPEAGRLAQHTQTVLANNRLAEPSATGQPAQRRPPRAGAPSGTANRRSSQHVIYIIKENRTYDQVLGDMPQGKGDPELCIFGERSHAQPAQAGPRVRAAGQLLLQRRAQRRRPPMDRRGLRHRLHREVVRRLAPELPATTATTPWPTPAAGSFGTTPGPRQDVRVYGEFVQGHGPLERPGPQGSARRSSTVTAITWTEPTRSRSAAGRRSRRWSRTFAPRRSAFPLTVPDQYRPTSSCGSCGEFEQRGDCRT